MSDDKELTQASLMEMLLMLFRRIFRADAAMFAFGALLICTTTVSAVVWAQNKNDEHIAVKVEEAAIPLRVHDVDHERRLQKLEDTVEAQKKTIDATQQSALETQLNMRLVVEKMGMQPVKLQTIEKQERLISSPDGGH